MQRDMDLSREILLKIEAWPEPVGWADLEIPDRTAEEVSYHVMLLAQAGLIEAENVSTLGSFEWKGKRLTWEGHEFVDAARNETVWKKTKAKVMERGGGLTFELIKSLLMSLMKQHVGL